MSECLESKLPLLLSCAFDNNNDKLNHSHIIIKTHTVYSC